MKGLSNQRKWISLVVLITSLLSTQAFVAYGFGQPQTSSARRSRSQPPRYRIPINQVIHVRMGRDLTSRNAFVGETFNTTVVDPVFSTNGVQLIPPGSVIRGRVTAVQRAQRNGRVGTIGVVFYHLRLPNGNVHNMNGSLTDLNQNNTQSNNEGTASGKKTSNRNVKFIGGGAAGGAIIGAIAGGGRGLAIGAGVGAAAGLIGGRLTRGKEAEVKQGTEFGVILNQSMSLAAFRP